jgi:hypothetical protein
MYIYFTSIYKHIIYTLTNTLTLYIGPILIYITSYVILINLSICMHIFTYIYIHICIYNIDIYHKSNHPHTATCMCIYIFMRMHMYIHIFVFRYLFYIYICIYLNKNIDKHMCIHINIYLQPSIPPSSRSRGPAPNLPTGMSLRMNESIYPSYLPLGDTC